jgi:ankyrin repeat protein
MAPAILQSTGETKSIMLPRFLINGLFKVLAYLILGISNSILANEFPLIDAVQAQDRLLAAKILKSGADPNISSQAGSPLLIACAYGDLEMVKLLIRHGAAINPIEAKEQTPLTTAAVMGSEKIVRFLLEKGAKVNTRIEQGGTALMAACQNGDIDTINLLLAKGADVHARAQNGFTALSFLADAGNWPAIQKLLKSKPDVNASDTQGNTPLHLAVLGKLNGFREAPPSHGRIQGWFVAKDSDFEKTVKVLTEAGANPLAKNNDGQTPLAALRASPKLQPTPGWIKTNRENNHTSSDSNIARLLENAMESINAK